MSEQPGPGPLEAVEEWPCRHVSAAVVVTGADVIALIAATEVININIRMAMDATA